MSLSLPDSVRDMYVSTCFVPVRKFPEGHINVLHLYISLHTGFLNLRTTPYIYTSSKPRMSSFFS